MSLNPNPNHNPNHNPNRNPNRNPNLSFLGGAQASWVGSRLPKWSLGFLGGFQAS